MRQIALAPLLLAAQTAAASSCQPALSGAGVHTAEGKEYVVAWRPEPVALRVSEFFVVEVAACSKSHGVLPTQLRLDAVMPEHKHGMNYRPTVTAAGDGRFRAEGMLLHMPGVWEFRFDLRGAGVDEIVRERISLQ